MSVTMEVDDLWDGIAAGILAEAGFKDGDVLSVIERGRTLIYSKCLDETPEITKSGPGFHTKVLNLQKGEGMLINIEDEMITISPSPIEYLQAKFAAKVEGNKI